MPVGQDRRQGGKQDPIGLLERGSVHLPSQHRELMRQHQDFDRRARPDHLRSSDSRQHQRPSSGPKWHNTVSTLSGIDTPQAPPAADDDAEQGERRDLEPEITG
jgi:hypothetical protein